jgi:hypothetical protein
VIATTEQRIPWLRGERRSAGAAGAVAARDQPQPPRRPLPEQLPRSRKVALLGAALALLVGAVVVFLGPLADRCGPVGEVKRCGDRPPPPVTSSEKPWTSAFEAVVPASGGAVNPVDGPAVIPEVLAPTVITPAPASAPKPKAARNPARAKVSVPVRRTAGQSTATETESSESESTVSTESGSTSDSEDE